jgi:hypothetical protein
LTPLFAREYHRFLREAGMPISRNLTTRARVEARFCAVLLMFFSAVLALFPKGKQVEINFGASVEIGRRELLFGSITSICEDERGNFLVLDGKEFSVLKFSPEGKLLSKFGQKGQGPGDFQTPDLIVLTPQNEIAVHEISFISFFKTDGTFIRRLELNGRLGLVYLGPNRFLAWQWTPDSRQQIMLDAKNNVVGTFHAQLRSSFSTTLADETGRSVMFNYSSDVYVPELLFGYCGGVGLIGISNLYNFSLLDEDGRVTVSIRRNLRAGKISGNERRFLEQEVRDFAKARNWPGPAVRELVKKIPDDKVIIRAVRISPRYAFVFLVPEDITRPDNAIPVDVFSPQGEFLGRTMMNKVPLFISGKAMYFVEADDSGNEYLRRVGFSLKRDGETE